MRIRADKAKVLGAYKLKQPHIPEGFVLVQDTREQAPLFARLPAGLMIKSTALEVGDYSILGFEDRFAIERKGISDFFGYIGKERDKTVEKMRRLQKCDWAGLVIEAKESDILKVQQFSQVHPEVARAALISFQVRYGVHVYFGATKSDVARYVLDVAIKFWRIAHEIN